MKKNIIIIALLFSFFVSAYSQEVGEVANKKPFEFHQPITTLFSRLDFLTTFPSSHSGDEISTDAINLNGLALTIGRKWYFHYEAATGFASMLDSKNARYAVSMGIGAGRYLLDVRNPAGVGSSLKLSVLYNIRYDSSIENICVGYGGLALLNYDYSFFRNFALRAGVYMGCYGLDIGGIGLNYGLSVGLAF